MHPRLFTSLVLIDPVIQEKSAEIDPSPNAPPNLAQMSTFRRDVWPSREQAAASFAKSGQMKVWDPRVLDRWVQFGLREGPTLLKPNIKAPQVTLACTPSQEVFTFLRPNYEGYGVNGKPIDRDTHPDLDASKPTVAPFYRSEPPKIYDRLGHVRPSVLYIFGSTSVVSGSKLNARKVARTGIALGGSGGAPLGRVKSVTLEGVGHLIPMEDARRTAVAVSEWVGDEMKRYMEEMKAWEIWQKKSLAEKQEVDEAWKRNIGGPLKRPAKI
jgi:pimeloyl-ACP methyl ester carboxylesterase